MRDNLIEGQIYVLAEMFIAPVTHGTVALCTIKCRKIFNNVFSSAPVTVTRKTHSNGLFGGDPI